MSGIYQLNQTTGSVTLPSSGNTFIGTSTNSELYSVDSSGNVTVYGTGSGGTINTGSFATTGSNTFTGVNTFSNNVAITSSSPVSFTLGSIFSLSNPTGSMQFTGSMNASGSLNVNGPITISGSGTVITSTQTGSFGSTNTGSFATTGSNVFSGSQEITGSLTISGSLFVSGNTINNIGPFNQTGISTFTGDITASGNISASGTITAGFYNIGNQAALIPTADTLAIADETGGALGLLYTKTTNVTIGTSTALNGAALGVNGNINTNSHITASGNISSSGTVIAGAVTTTGNISSSAGYLYGERVFASRGFIDNLATDTIYGGDGNNNAITLNAVDNSGMTLRGPVTASSVNIVTTDTSSSFGIGTGEQIIPVWSGMNVSSSGIISQAYPSGRIGRTTEILGDATFDLGGGSVYPVDGHHVMYHSGSRELWRATGEWDLSGFTQPRSVGHLLKYGDGNTAGNVNTFNDYQLVVGENISDVWGGAFLKGSQSGSTYGANQQYAGFFVSASLGLPGTPQGHDKAFTIYTGQQTGKAFNIYNANDPDSLSSADPVFSVSASGATIIKGLPTTEPIGPDAITGSLWISGSGGAGATNSGYLMVFNP